MNSLEINLFKTNSLRKVHKMLPMVQCSIQGKVGRITLQLPHSKRALDVQACRLIRSTLQHWRYDPSVELVLFDRDETSRDFNASEHLIEVRDSARSGTPYYLEFFEEYFHLCKMIDTYPKPYIAIIDGHTFDTGIGVSLLGSSQIVTERGTVSFPETGYGMALCGGASKLLTRLDGEIGTWLALTGYRLTGREIVAAGLASHLCESKHLDGLIKSLIHKGIEAMPRKCNIDPCLLHDREEIDHLFAGPCVMSILNRLKTRSDWSKRQATKIRAKSPLSTKIVLRQLRTTELVDAMSTNLKIEYRVVSRIVTSQNFKEGTRAYFEDKDFWPNWQPVSFIATTGDMVGHYFSPLPDREYCPKKFDRAIDRLGVLPRCHNQAI